MKRFLGAFGIVTLGLGLGFGCSSSSKPPPAAEPDGGIGPPINEGDGAPLADSPSSTDAPIDTKRPDANPNVDYEAGTKCTQVPNSATPVPEIDVNADWTPVGGTIVAGTYIETALNTYTGANGHSGPSGLSVQGTCKVTATTIECTEIELESGTISEIESYAWTYTTSGTTLTYTVMCASTGAVSSTMPYSVLNNGTELHLALRAGGEDIFTKQ